MQNIFFIVSQPWVQNYTSWGIYTISQLSITAVRTSSNVWSQLEFEFPHENEGFLCLKQGNSKYIHSLN